MFLNACSVSSSEPNRRTLHRSRRKKAEAIQEKWPRFLALSPTASTREVSWTSAKVRDGVITRCVDQMHIDIRIARRHSTV